MSKHKKRKWGGAHTSGYRFRPKAYLMTEREAAEIKAKLEQYRLLQQQLAALNESTAE